ncbi:MAG: isoamylase early set domain-containing protein [Proteobacteria bacterium]|nr:isoamylase early set domain-containing protein [Pseudomonadota bacterium]
MKKSYSKDGKTCRVTFRLPADACQETDGICVAGEWNGWDALAHSMKKAKDGSFSLTLPLPANAEYQFRYVADGWLWQNDPQADGYVANGLGEENGLVVT